MKSKDLLNLFAEASLAKILVLPDAARDSTKVKNRGYSMSLFEYAEKSNRRTSSSKIAPQLRPEDSIPFSKKLPSSGSMRNGLLYRRADAEPRIYASAGGAFVKTEIPKELEETVRKKLSRTSGNGSRNSGSTPLLKVPTPQAGDTHCLGGNKAQKPRHFLQLPSWVQLNLEKIPTPQASDWKRLSGKGFSSLPVYVKTGNQAIDRRTTQGIFPTPKAWDAGREMTKNNKDSYLKMESPALSIQVSATQKGGGKLNPLWVEWLMGFPIGWTVLRD